MKYFSDWDTPYEAVYHHNLMAWRAFEAQWDLVWHGTLGKAIYNAEKVRVRMFLRAIGYL